MGGQRIDAGEALGAGDDAVDEHVLVLHLLVALQRGFLVDLLAREGIQEHGELEGFAEGDAVARHGPVAEVLLHVARDERPDPLRQLEELGIAGQCVSPEYAFDVDDVAALAELFRRVGKVVLLQRDGDPRIAGGLVVGLHGAEEHGERPAHRLALTAEAAFGTTGGGNDLAPFHLRPPAGLALLGAGVVGDLGRQAEETGKALVVRGFVKHIARLRRQRVVQDVVHVGLALGLELRVFENVSQPGEAVHVVGGLLEAPPVGTPVVGVLAHLEVAGPAAAVERIRHRLRMARQAVLLPLQDLPDPAFGRDVIDQAFGENGIGRHGNPGGAGNRGFPLLLARDKEQGNPE